MKALLAALLVCLGAPALATAPCEPAVQAAGYTVAPPADAFEMGGPPRMQPVVARATLADAGGGLTLASPRPAPAPARGPSKPAEPPEQNHGHTLLLVGVALMAGIALRRHATGRE